MPESRFSVDTTVIVAVYNNFHWLRLVLDGLRYQTFKDFEVVIADDGSSEENVRKLEHYMREHSGELKIIHSWQPDEGWRKNRCLNAAIRKASGEYLVFIDGDCIPHPEFVADHRRLRRRGVVTGGRRVETGPALNSALESQQTLNPGFFSHARQIILRNIFKEGFSLAMSQLRRTIRFPFISGHAFGKRDCGILGANFGIYREDIEKVNGFDERYVDPGTGEDCDLDLRLENAGIRHVKYSHYALMMHRRHERLFWGAENNARLYREAREKGLTYVETGLCRNNIHDGERAAED